LQLLIPFLKRDNYAASEIAILFYLFLVYLKAIVIRIFCFQLIYYCCIIIIWCENKNILYNQEELVANTEEFVSEYDICIY